jgi:eukaryotic-like serine/threonine-protein kinase
VACEQPSVKSIFAEAAEIASPEDRAAYLDRACGGDAGLRRKVDDLLRASEADGRYLKESPALDFSDGTVFDVRCGCHDDDPDRTATKASRTVRLDSFAATGPQRAAPPFLEETGVTIGPYKLLKKIGEGGMGAVFFAEQEKPVCRTVALKVIKPGMDTRQFIARFEAERQALAIMDHPHIARVLDVGATDSGRPFLVMELVKGVPITKYCDRYNLTPQERLELLIPVCHAIQHAHQKGIIHRDIKPSNVLVTLQDGKAMPKVIDFGVAKATEQRLTEGTMCTEIGQVMGTLEYMSPEQAEMGALDIDTRSDVYSLGVMLYELLTGSTPLDHAKLHQVACAAILKRIREELPTKPSTRLSESKDALPSISAHRMMEPSRLTKLVRGELDWIVMKALEKDRTRRYATAIGFAKDIRRYLDGDPVDASPPSATYKLRKFARKYRTALATASAFTVLLVAATALSIVLALWANRERTRAEDRERLAVEAVKRFRDAVANEPVLRNDPALEELRKRLLKEPLAFFRALRDRLQSDRNSRPESLARLARASFDLGDMVSAIGDMEDALIAYRESLAIYRKLADANPTRFDDELAAGHLGIGNILSATGKSSDAMTAYKSALAIHQKLAYANPADPDIQCRLADSHHNVGLLLSATGRPVEAIKSYQSAQAIQQKLADSNPTVTKFRSRLANTHNSHGLVLHATGKTAEALKAFQSALTIRQRLADANPTISEFQIELANSHQNIGVLLVESGKPVEAMTAFQSALAIEQKLAGLSPAVTEYQRHLASCHFNIGRLLMCTGKPAEALEAYESSLAIERKLADDNPTVTRFQSALAASLQNMGVLLTESGKPAEALKYYKSALAIQQKLTRDHPNSHEFASAMGAVLGNIAEIDLAANRLEEARARLRQAVRSQQQALGAIPENPTYREFLTNHLRKLIDVTRGLGDAEGLDAAARELANLPR